MMRYLPLLSILIGCLGWQFFAPYSALATICIFGMLFFTFIRMERKSFGLRRTHFLFLALQLFLSLSLYYFTSFSSLILAQAILICLLCPVATASPTIVGFFGGDIGFTASYVLLSHLMITVVAPLLLPLVGTHPDISFWSLSAEVVKLVSPMIVAPILLAIAIRGFAPKLTKYLQEQRQASFILWVSSVIFILARTMDRLTAFDVNWGIILQMSGVGLLCCLGQYLLGYFLAPYVQLDSHTSRQCWGQKNTTLGLWLAFVTLHPYACVAPASYIVWQNLINSFLLSRQKSH